MIELKDIVKIYGDGENKVEALKGVSINFREHELVSILGPSGCGKTTLLNILGGLDKYSNGDLIINGKSTKQFKSGDWDTYRNQRVGFVFQNYNLIPHLSVLRNVELSLTLAGVTSAERRARSLKALEVVGLSDQVKKRPNQLSGGQMQRVAIARAIVNNPDIILADEPTGALDSVTSVQVMDILQNLAKERLVVMVTHNKELANSYSTRIIEFLDGKIINDSKPFKPTHIKDDAEIKEKTDLIKQAVVDELGKDIDNNNQDIVNNATNIDKNCKNKKRKPKKSAMSFFTAFNLSLKNLFTKKARTILTSFAGSIGIIGVALVLAVSNGFTKYINKMQSDTLSGYPISITTITADLNSISNAFSGGGQNKLEKFPDEDEIYIYDNTANLASLSKYNFISPEFIDYIKEFENGDGQNYLNDVSYSYASPFTVIGKQGATYKKINTELSSSVIGASSSGIFYEGLPSEEFVKSQYDVIYGSYPKEANELALVISSTNTLSKSLLDSLAIEYTVNDDASFENIKFEDLVTTSTHQGKEYKLIYNDYYYIPTFDSDGSTITGFTKNQDLEAMYNYDDSKSLTLKITGILRVNPDSPLSIYSQGIVYTPKLTDLFKENALQSQIVKMQKQNLTSFYFPYVLNVAELGDAGMGNFKTPQELQLFAKINYGVDISVENAIEYNLQQYGASSIPNSICLYPKDFESKDKITSYIDAWNNDEAHSNNKIYYADATSLLSNTLGQLVNIISYVLIAFASISLVVSSIMIGIITYVSVVERTKEIGVLRALGARKKDIRRVFNAETLIIGFSAGLIGVLASALLTIPINLIINSLSQGIGNIAILNIWHAVALVLISMGLTLISGLIPAHIASKKDPVVALRTE